MRAVQARQGCQHARTARADGKHYGTTRGWRLGMWLCGLSTLVACDAGVAHAPLRMGPSDGGVIVIPDAGERQGLPTAVPPRPRPELERYFAADKVQEDGAFGAALALTHDQLVVVAAWEDVRDSGGLKNDSGAIYAFERTPVGWTKQQEVPREGAGPRDGLFAFKAQGSSIGPYAYSATLTGPELLVSTAGDDRGKDVEADPVPDSGAVHVYAYADGQYTPRQTLKAPVPGVDDHFGYRTALSGPWLAVSALSEDSSATGGALDDSRPDSGAVFMFVRRDTGWEYHSMLKAPNADPGDRFGSSVALEGGLLVVGAMYESSRTVERPLDNSVERAGAVYFYRLGEDEIWRFTGHIKASDPKAEDAFGVSLALSGPLLAVGAWGQGRAADVRAATEEAGGRVILFRSGTEGWRIDGVMRVDDPAALFGTSVALSDDSTLWVGAPGEKVNNVRSGAVYVFDRGVGDWKWSRTIVPQNAGPRDLFGMWIDTSESTIAIAAPGKDGVPTASTPSGIENAGAVYLYRF